MSELEADLSVIDSVMDQRRAAWHDRIWKAWRDGKGVAFIEMMDMAVQSLEDSDDKLIKSVGDLAQIGWCSVLMGFGEAMRVRAEAEASDAE